MQLCDGSLSLRVNATLGGNGKPLLDIPSGSINCALIGKIDLSKILGSLATNDPNPTDSTFVVTDHLIAIAKLGSASYDPPRPILPSLLSTPKDVLSVLNEEKTVTITTPNQSATGDVTVRMLGYDQPYYSSTLGITFLNVADFTVTNSGFKGVDRVANFIFDSIELRINLNPIALVGISFEGPLNMLLGQKPATNKAGGLDGALQSAEAGLASLITVRIDADLMAQDGLKETINKQGHQVTQPVIDGAPSK